MNQVQFRLGFRRRSRWWGLQRSQSPLTGFKGTYTSKEKWRTDDGRAGEEVIE